jgi:Tol biopolymer transport system component
VKAITPLSGDAEHTQIELLDAATGQFHPLTNRTTLESYPLFSPDGANIAYWYPQEAKPGSTTKSASSPQRAPATALRPRISTATFSVCSGLPTANRCL